MWPHDAIDMAPAPIVTLSSPVRSYKFLYCNPPRRSRPI
jgi:hypothetical protein